MRAGHYAHSLLCGSVVLFLLFFAAGELPVAADVVVLKSGRRIQAVNVEERDGKVYYEIELGRIGIPRRLVERIERGDYVAQPPKVAAVPAAVDLAALSDADVLRVVINGTVDRGLLLRLEREASANASSAARESRRRPGERAAAAHVRISQLHSQRGNPRAAADSLRQALRFAPNHPGLLLRLATLEIQLERYDAALTHLRPVVRDSRLAFEGYRLQGWVYYRKEEMNRAVAAWERALRLRSDSELEAQLRRIRREADASGDFRQQASGHFLLRYEGDIAKPPRLARTVLRALDRMYGDLSHEFNLAPREAIVVLFYPNQAFYALTGLPPGVHGVYDGKIRVPVEGLVSLTPALEQVLRHELVHAFVFLKSRGRARRWLQEGLAQWHAHQRPQHAPSAFRSLFEPRDGSALGRIEAGFGGDWNQVTAAYSAAWLVVDTLQRRFGRGDMVQMLDALAAGRGTEAALRRAYRLRPADLDRLVFDALR